MRPFVFVCVVLVSISSAFACSFHYDAVSIDRYYRDEGWQLPGIQDFNPRAHVEGLPFVKPIPGLTLHVLPHNEAPFVITLPGGEFSLNGKEQRMESMTAKAGIVRWSSDGQVVAYSYGLIPVQAHKANGKWIIDVEVGCIFTATFIDDKGDGVFRVLVPGSLTVDLVPAWVQRKEN